MSMSKERVSDSRLLYKPLSRHLARRSWESGALSSRPTSAVGLLGVPGRALSLPDLALPHTDGMALMQASLRPLCVRGAGPQQWSLGPQQGAPATCRRSRGEGGGLQGGKKCSLQAAKEEEGRKPGGGGELITVTQSWAYKLQKWGKSEKSGDGDYKEADFSSTGEKKSAEQWESVRCPQGVPAGAGQRNH